MYDWREARARIPDIIQKPDVVRYGQVAKELGESRLPVMFTIEKMGLKPEVERLFAERLAARRARKKTPKVRKTASHDHLAYMRERMRKQRLTEAGRERDRRYTETHKAEIAAYQRGYRARMLIAHAFAAMPW